MGSWSDLDANYPPNALTPATAVVVALAHLTGRSAPAVPPELGRDPDLVARSAHSLAHVACADFLGAAQRLLSERQRQTLAAILCAHHAAAGFPPTQQPILATLLSGLRVSHTVAAQARVDWEIFAQ